MLRAIGLAVFALGVAAFAACGGDDSTTGTTTTPTTAASATASTHASATPTSAAATATGAAGPGSGGSWTVSGALTGTAVMSGFNSLPAVTCDIVGTEEEVSVSGSLNGTFFQIQPNFPAGAAATLDYGAANNFLFANITYGQYVSDLQHWDENAGGAGTSGTATVQADGSGSMQVTVPVSANSPGGATGPITVSGEWTCP